jgi:protein SCO1/2
MRRTQLQAIPLLLMFTAICAAQEGDRVGIEEHLGTVVPLDELTFTNEQDEEIRFSSLTGDKPIVLTLVYYRCPGICTPLLQELVSNADKADIEPGIDYQLITISFEPKEDAEMARLKKTNMLAEFKNKKVPPESWSFLTGDEENIRKITEAVGFQYMKDTNEIDYVHAASIIFLSPDGKIARYLNGKQFNPAEMELAVADAAEGRSRSFMQRMQWLCYTYDREGQGYVLRVNRIILGVTMVFALGFGAFLLLRGGRNRNDAQAETGVTES